MKRPKANKRLSYKRTAIVIVVCLALVIMLATGIVYVRHNNPCDVVPKQASPLGTYDKPCELVVTVVPQSKTGNVDKERALLTRSLQGYDASIRQDSLPDSGVYYVHVAAGTERKVIDHLKSQPGISSAKQRLGCTKDCKVESVTN